MQIAPNQHQAQLQMGSVLYKEDRLRESVEHYKIAVALAPQDRYTPIATRILRRVSFHVRQHRITADSCAPAQASAAFIGQHTGRCL
jgi:hypothetical protein